jgi:hypothetical protein
MDDVYGGDILKAEDLPLNYRGMMRVERVTLINFAAKDGKPAESKLALHFQGKTKALALNVTNANMMAEVAGSRDYDTWAGHSVVVYRTMTDMGGKRVPAIRLDHPNAMPARQAAPPPPPPPPPPVSEYASDFQATDDDVPF